MTFLLPPDIKGLLKYSSKKINEKEVTRNDSTGAIKVKLWVNTIKEVPENDKYFLGRVTVRKWPAGVLNLMTTLPYESNAFEESNFANRVSAARIGFF